MTRYRVRWVAFAVALVLVGFAVVLAVRVAKGRQEASIPRLVLEHRDAPAFTLENLADGRPIVSSSLTGKTYVVNFFNSWCIPCRQETPALQAFYAAHKSEPDFAMVGIIIDDQASPVRSYVRDHGIGWPVGVDPHGRAALDFGTTGQPETYVVAPDGVAVCGALGPSTQADLETWLTAARSGQECTG